MTFDDGPTSYTPQLLDILNQKGIKATFHLTTKFLTDPAVQSMVQRIASSGHLIGLRTEASWNLLTMSDDQIRSSIARQANVMASFIGYFPKFIRLPYNGYDERVLRAVESTGAVVTTHNLESYDYTNDGNRVLNAFQLAVGLAGNQGNFISLQHDSIQSSVAATPKIIDNIKANGYKFVTLDNCLGMGEMTKNKTPLKGGNGPAAPIGMGGSSPLVPSSSNTGSSGGTGIKDDAPEDDGKTNGQSSDKKNGAYPIFGSSNVMYATASIIISVVLSLPSLF